MLVPLYIFLMVPVPIGLGFVLSMALRELYVRQGGTFEQEKPPKLENSEEPENIETETGNDPSDAGEDEAIEDNADKEFPAAEPPSVSESVKGSGENVAAITPNVDEIATTDEKDEDSENVEANPQAAVKTENKPRDVFSESGLTPPVNLHIDNAVADILDDVNPIVPTDLSERLEEVSATESEPQEQAADEYDDYDDDWETPPHADDISERLDDLNILEKTERHEDISPLAVEVLGEDFDFDSLIKQPADEVGAAHEVSGNQEIIDLRRSAADNQQESAADKRHLVDGEVAESGEWTAESEQSAECQLPSAGCEADTTEIFSLYDHSMVLDSVITPVPVDDADELCFSEASRPMFVKRIRT